MIKYKTVVEIASIYGVDVRTVQRWAKEIPGAKKNGKYIYEVIVRGVYELQRNKIDNRGGGTLTEKKELKLEKDIHLLDLEIAEKEKRFVDAIDLEKTLGKVFVEFKNIRLIPRAYSQQLLNICLGFMSDVKKRKSKKGVLETDKKKLSVQIEKLLIKQLDKALESLSRGFDPGKGKWKS